MRRTLLARLLTLAALALVATPAHSQDGSDSPWLPWFGCWSPAQDDGSLTCVVPVRSGAAAEAEQVVVEAGRIVERRRVIADGQRRALADEACDGWESARPSDDGTRIYLSGEMRCGTLPQQATAGILGITPQMEWLEIRGIRTGADATAGIQRARALPWRLLPDVVADELRPYERAVIAARAAAAQNLSSARIVDVANAVDAHVAQAWLVETVQQGTAAFRLPRSDLLQLADAKVPTAVIDAAVAAAHPDRFTLTVADARLSPRQSGGASSLRQSTWNDCQRLGLNPWVFTGPSSWIHYGMVPMTLDDCQFLRSLGYNPIWLSRFNTVGQYPGFFPGAGGYPITVVVTPISPAPQRPNRVQVVNGRGYRPRPSGGSGQSGVSAPSSSSGGQSAGSSGSSSGSGRTAKPRKP